ncbi:transporter protein smf2 [Paecilomyces variotii No. 5]|uniref:Transporter protein smf2 n=1 Tax=Byssochlamys spectabilis (strain No. 5 / NBRC 109023) TaxID=1356009 RepID=V5FC58_BYSSN|nr:transporter protein smf2 [Paecilomyces variotii No. 5]
MNCPSRTDDTLDRPDWNQNPPLLNADGTTREDLNGISNAREQRDHASKAAGAASDTLPSEIQQDREDVGETEPREKAGGGVETANSQLEQHESTSRFPHHPVFSKNFPPFQRAIQVLVKFARFVGPGFLVAVAYIDPGNYSTDVAAGADTRYALLFVVLMSNLFAIFLQSLCIKLGSVTGLNLAENCRAHLPRWLVIILYIFAEAAIIATDIAEVVGSAIALNLLAHIPLVAGCAITLADVLFLLIFYRPNGSMFGLRAFEFFVMALVLGVVICFCIQLSLIHNQSIGDVFRGYVPSSAVVRGNGIYQSCGILGATVMPHSLFLGSGIIQPRLKSFDVAQGYVDPDVPVGSNGGEVEYRPSVDAIRSCMKYSIVELTLSLFTFALFVNSAILIVAGAALYGTPGADNADLFGIYHLLSSSIAPAAATIFALALLLSGLSAGIVCTIAGQIVSEGMLRWSIKPWMRRLITRSISIIPSIAIAGAVGKEGLNATLNASQVVLSVILPFVTAPLVYFTCRNRYMTVRCGESTREGDDAPVESVKMKNNWFVTILCVLIWLVIAIMNVALLVLVGLGKA